MSEKLPFNKNNELFVWGPVPMRGFFNDNWYRGIYIDILKKYPNDVFPFSIALNKNNRLVFLTDLADLRKQGKETFFRHILPEDARAKLRHNYDVSIEKIHKWQKRFDKTDFKNISDGDFLKIWNDFNRALDEYWVDAVVPELANYGGDDLIEIELRKYIKDDNVVRKGLEILISPESPSFYQKEELALSKASDLEAHRQEYIWIQNSYNGAKKPTLSFFETRKKELPADFRPQIEARGKLIQSRKKEFQKEWNLPESLMDLAKALVLSFEWQDERKEEIFRYITHKDILVTEFGRRFKMEKEDLLNFCYYEIIDILGGKISESEIIERRSAYGFIAKAGSVKAINASKANEYWNIYVDNKVESNVTDFKGITASTGGGSVRGKVAIVLDPHQSDFKAGTILVAPMTSPEYVFLMKKALAIITDAGGLTSHAAVTSREFGIPCIVGTKIATKVLKDGDEVEVDAEKGVIKIIK